MSLVLRRRSGQAIVVDGNIKIRCHVDNNGDVKLVIDAPREIVVDREEIHERKTQNAGE